jgi:site-specific DNA-cytosine methylase
MYRVLTGQERKNHFGLVKLDPERPSPTTLSWVGGTTTGLIHPLGIRKLTIDEAKALASYPKAFEIRGSYNVRCGRIRNSVPPLFMRAIALHIRKEIPVRETGKLGRLTCFEIQETRPQSISKCKTGERPQFPK